MSYSGLINDKTNISEDGNDDLPQYGHARQNAFWKWMSIISQVYMFVSLTVILAVVVARSDTLRDTAPAPATPDRFQALGTNKGDIFEDQYGHDQRFMSLDPQYDFLWAGWGDAAQIEVPHALYENETMPAAISIYHQMHCLRSFRTALQDAKAGKEVAFDWRENHHWPHCLDYLRRTIECWADDTVETMHVVNGKLLPFIDGSRDVRQCRRKERVYEMVADKGIRVIPDEEWKEVHHQ